MDENNNGKTPNSTDISSLLKDMSKMSKDIVNPLKSLMQAMGEMNKVLTFSGMWNSVKFNVLNKVVTTYFKNFATMMTAIAKGFEKLGATANFKSILELLGGKEGVENIIMDTKTGREKKRQKIGKKVGFLEVLKGFFELPKMLDNQQIWKTTSIHRKLLKWKVDYLFKFFDEIFEKMSAEAEKLVTGEQDVQKVLEQVNAMTETVASIPLMMDSILSAHKGPLKRARLNKFFDWFGATNNDKKYQKSFLARFDILLTRIRNLMASNPIDTFKNFKGLSDNLAEGVSIISKSFTKATILFPTTMIGIGCYGQIMKKLFDTVLNIVGYVSTKGGNTPVTTSVEKLRESLEAVDVMLIAGNSIFIILTTMKIPKNLQKKVQEVVNNFKEVLPLFDDLAKININNTALIAAKASVNTAVITATAMLNSFTTLNTVLILFRPKRLWRSRRMIRRMRDIVMALYEVSKYLIVLAMIPKNIINKGLRSMYRILFGRRGLFTLVRKISRKKNMRRALKAVVVIGMMGIVVAATGLLFVGMIMLLPLLIPAYLAIIGIWLAFKGMFFILNMFKKNGMQSILAILIMMLFIGAMMMAVMAIYMIGILIVEKLKYMLLGLLGFLIIVGIMVGLMVVLGFLSEFALPGAIVLILLAATLLIINVAFYLFALTLEKLSQIKISEDSLTQVLIPIGGMIEYMFDNIKLFNPITIGLTLANIMMLLPVVLAIGGIALLLEKISNLTIPDEGAVWDPKKNAFDKYRTMNKSDFQRATENAGLMLTTVLGIFDGLDLSTIEDTSAWTLKKLGYALDIIGHLGSLINVIEKISNLVMPAPNAVFDSKTGKFSKYVQMSEDEFDRCQFQACQLLGTVLDIFKDMDLSAIEDTSKRTIKKLGMAMNIFGAMGPMIDRIQVLATGKVTSFDDKGKPTGDPIDFTTPETKQKIRSSVMSLFTSFIDPFVKKEPTLGMSLVEYIADFVNKADDAFDDLTPIVKSMGEVKKLLQPFIDATWDNTVVSENIKTIICTPLISLDVNHDFATMQMNINRLDDLADTLKYLRKSIEPLLNGGTDSKQIMKVFGAMIYSPLQFLDNKFNDAQIRGNINRLKELTSIAERLGKVKRASKIEKMSQAGIDFLKQVNVMKLDNLKSAVSLFYQLRKITENVRGNFDKLADTLKVDLIENLEKISELLDDIVSKQTLPSMGGNSVQNASQKPATGDLATVIDSKPKPATEKEKQEQRKKEKEKRNQDEIVRQLIDIGEQMREIIKKIS